MTRNNEPTERHVTTDHSTIREWADEADAEPVQSVGGDRDLTIIPSGDHGAEYERVDWDEFFEALERENQVVATQGAGQGRMLQVLDRNEATQHSELSSEELESTLMEGETVTTEVTETTVVEETIVEHADIESELIDRSTVSETVVDAELQSRDLGECQIEGLEDHRTMHDDEMFEVGHATVEDFEVTVQADEVWTVTKEVGEQAAIESHVVDRDVETSAEVQSDTVESETMESRIDLSDVEGTILESGILDSSAHDAEAAGEELFRSEFTDDDAIVTEFIERKTVEEEVSVEREFSGTIDAAETRSVHDGAMETVDAEMVSADEYEVGELDVDAYDRPGTTGGADVGTTGGADVGTTGESSVSSVTIDESAQGKTVVDQSGEEVGIVSEVEAGTLYVDPHPSLTDKIRAKLDWGDMDEESYPLDEDRIDEITRSNVKIRGYE
jgi:hypothetical protein